MEENIMTETQLSNCCKCTFCNNECYNCKENGCGLCSYCKDRRNPLCHNCYKMYENYDPNLNYQNYFGNTFSLNIILILILLGLLYIIYLI